MKGASASVVKTFRNPSIIAASLKALSLVLMCAFALVASAADATNGQEMSIAVVKEGALVVVDASFDVPVPPKNAWLVLTDYEGMTRFMPHLQSSRILERSDNGLQVSQSGDIPFGPFSISFEYLRSIELVPYSEIRSHAMGGSIKKGEVITRLVEEGAGTRVLYHSEVVPNIWLPFGIGSRFVRTSIVEQLASLRNEMLRRWETAQP